MADTSLHLRPLRRAATSTLPELPHLSDDVLWEILLLLPPLPSSLPRASLVCTRWRRLLSDPTFLRRFRALHRRPPLLGFFFFNRTAHELSFKPILYSPDRISPARFSLTLDYDDDDAAGGGYWYFDGSRHGRLLLINWCRSSGCRKFLVWEPVTGDLRRLPAPPQLDRMEQIFFQGTVVCAACDRGRVLGGCHSGPFQVVLVGAADSQAFACVYSSETGEWGDFVAAPAKYTKVGSSSVMLGNSIYWILLGDKNGILKFDMERQSLDVIKVPNCIYQPYGYHHDGLYLITEPVDGGLGLIIMFGSTAILWKRVADSDDDDEGWLPGRKIHLGRALLPWLVSNPPTALVYLQDHNAIFLLTNHGVYMVHLESWEVRKLCESIDGSDGRPLSFVFPYSSFYAAGI